MKHGFMLSTAAFLLAGTAALAQTSYSTDSTTTTTAVPPPVVVAPPVVAVPMPGTLSTTETERGSDGAGNSYQSTKTTYGSPDAGVGSESTTTTTEVPPPVGYVTTKKTVTTTTTGGD